MKMRCASCGEIKKIARFAPAGMVDHTTIKAYDALCRECVDRPRNDKPVEREPGSDDDLGEEEYPF